MVWTPPTKPDPGIASPSDIVSKDVEMAGAAYRVQPGRISTNDAQVPYYEGFTRTKNAFDQTDISVTHNEVGMDGPLPPPDKAPAGDLRPRAAKSDAAVGGKANRTNVQGGQETSGEAPAPLFTQAVGRDR